jgi:DNA-binding NarL/FixJ family response regulator
MRTEQLIQVAERKGMNQQMRVLIVDDQERARLSMKALLGALYQASEIREAADGYEAVHLVDEFHPDLILMDARMPKMNGLEALRLIRSKYPQIKIVILSMYPDFKAEALAAGADAFISKSDPPEKLRATLKDILASI